MYVEAAFASPHPAPLRCDVKIGVHASRAFRSAFELDRMRYISVKFRRIVGSLWITQSTYYSHTVTKKINGKLNYDMSRTNFSTIAGRRKKHDEEKNMTRGGLELSVSRYQSPTFSCKKLFADMSFLRTVRHFLLKGCTLYEKVYTICTF